MRLYAGVTGSVSVAKAEDGSPAPLVEVFLAYDMPTIDCDPDGKLDMVSTLETVTFQSGPKPLRQLAYELLKLADEADAFFESVRSGTAFVSPVSPEPTEENPK